MKESTEVRKCVTLPMLEEWYSSEKECPANCETVMGWVTKDGTQFVAQVVFRGNMFCGDYQLGGRSVHVAYWLHVGATAKADTIANV